MLYKSNKKIKQESIDKLENLSYMLESRHNTYAIDRIKEIINDIKNI